MISKKYFPAVLTCAVSMCAVLVRIALSIMYQDMETGVYNGSSLLMSILTILLIALCFACGLYSAKLNFKKPISVKSAESPVRIFVFACCGFFQIFTAVFMIYTMIKGYDFFDGATDTSEFFVMLLSIGCALFFFLKASPAAAKLTGSPFYRLLYLFPVLWAALRLYVLFRSYTGHVVYMTENLQILSLVCLTVYFLIEARFAGADAPVKGGIYAVITAFSLVIVPLSALPTLILSLVYKTSDAIGSPVLCLVELSVCAYILFYYLNTVKESDCEN